MQEFLTKAGGINPHCARLIIRKALSAITRQQKLLRYLRSQK